MPPRRQEKFRAYPRARARDVMCAVKLLGVADPEAASGGIALLCNMLRHAAAIKFMYSRFRCSPWPFGDDMFDVRPLILN